MLRRVGYEARILFPILVIEKTKYKRIYSLAHNECLRDVPAAALPHVGG